MSEPTSGSNSSLGEAVAEVVDAFMQQVQQGHRPEVEEVAREHPHIADILRRLLPALPLLQPPSESPPADASDPSAPAELGSVGSRLGDFRILGELGAGGMGVVYRAEQVSLCRPVALKVLPLAATLDSKLLQRFQNEARAAASLQHAHIVPVYAIGCERGIHFYAMQLIDGLPLTAVIGQQQERRQQQAHDQKSPGTAEVSLASTSPGEDSLAADASALQVTTAYAPPQALRPPSALLGGKADSVSSAVPSEVEREYFRWAARLGVQAAEALDHAHQMGVVHRDVKPANLLLDAKGHLWVTDFGLAQVRQQEGGLTQTGDIVGTIRYMSPEQAMAQRDVLDQRSDVYSLGATLYELLTLQPAFASTDRQELLRQVISEEPARPRQLRRSIPVDLETIVLKAMEKRPQDRYATAQELADDLNRFLDDQPIRARRPGLGQRLVKWGRRHQSLLAVAGAALILVSIVSSVSAVLILNAYRSEKRHWEAAQQSEANAQVQRRRAEANLRKAVRAWGESFDFFLEHPAHKDSEGLAAARKMQTEKAQKFLQALLAEVDRDPDRLPESALLHGELGRVYGARGDSAGAEREFRQAIALYQQLQAGPEAKGAYEEDLKEMYLAIIRIANGLAEQGANLSEKYERRQETSEKYVQAIHLCELVPVNWVLPRSDRDFNEIVHEPNTYRNACKWLYAANRPAEAEGAAGRAIVLAEAAPARYPGTLYLPVLWQMQAESYLYRGLVRSEAGRVKEAEEDFRSALALFAKMAPSDIDAFAAYPDLARVEQAYAELLWARGAREQARDGFRRAEAAWRMVKHPNNARRHSELAWFLCTCPEEAFRKPQEALALSGKAVTLLPQDCRMWRAHGAALLRTGSYQDAAEALQKGMLLGGGGESADRFFLAMARARLGDREQSLKDYARAVEEMGTRRAQDPQLRRFRAEAAALLGLKAPAATQGKGEPPLGE